MSKVLPDHSSMDDDIRTLASLVPQIPALWRLTSIREVVLSGFQLELYTMEERAFAYWYTAQVLEDHIDCLNNIQAVVSRGIYMNPNEGGLFSCRHADSTAWAEHNFQHTFLEALRELCLALVPVSCHLSILKPYPDEISDLCQVNHTARTSAILEFPPSV
jgi:hypothetical protein